MTPFAIFALILTTVYVIYFVVTITRDVLASRKSAEESDTSETLDTSFMESETVHIEDPEPIEKEESVDEQPATNTPLSAQQEAIEDTLGDIMVDYGEGVDAVTYRQDITSSAPVSHFFREIEPAAETSEEVFNRDEM